MKSKSNAELNDDESTIEEMSGETMILGTRPDAVAAAVVVGKPLQDSCPDLMVTDYVPMIQTTPIQDKGGEEAEGANVIHEEDSSSSSSDDSGPENVVDFTAAESPWAEVVVETFDSSEKEDSTLEEEEAEKKEEAAEKVDDGGATANDASVGVEKAKKRLSSKREQVEQQQASGLPAHIDDNDVDKRESYIAEAELLIRAAEEREREEELHRAKQQTEAEAVDAPVDQIPSDGVGGEGEEEDAEGGEAVEGVGDGEDGESYDDGNDDDDDLPADEQRKSDARVDSLRLVVLEDNHDPQTDGDATEAASMLETHGVLTPRAEIYDSGYWGDAAPDDDVDSSKKGCCIIF